MPGGAGGGGDGEGGCPAVSAPPMGETAQRAGPGRPGPGGGEKSSSNRDAHQESNYAARAGAKCDSGDSPVLHPKRRKHAMAREPRWAAIRECEAEKDCAASPTGSDREAREREVVLYCTASPTGSERARERERERERWRSGPKATGAVLQAPPAESGDGRGGGAVLQARSERERDREMEIMRKGDKGCTASPTGIERRKEERDREREKWRRRQTLFCEPQWQPAEGE